ncbi:DNA polymerase III subunit gamma and tau [Corynebacterium pygosceleis]|uniref:DNA polymerase III subunit gamma/tau n=1 Tax=Corynebacterium pygosceleis TaxID=2800406 RepID=A0A9Q4GKL4_9CORY|nr:DNA polymerase III subunit gamma and tau [Corynebacterium pygosceleis]MCK7637335.1 DNA polymerase III subunit gamma and tau [Corynebacterium pygosceleis]MCK7675985.1 DNA polymerase III subunit gamma and tau [Corynebacterium pygosceleis]MCL0119889.1 DNA polymerase III subunit gamma and tau [Corynebacterium pygosceleis]MCX7445238.1 DNA polymerase III subunit gamma and tau [Corynebacterium pygosceleis]MCX7468337.1 DNA polymerase III subunit gamma and tau [Corynebacterium pygosceleis]
MALYRKYRPATFSEVIGQEHVTDPLSVALDSGRINHAYLFSGPRGCGKTSSARIMARSLNCAEGPTSTPCGTCNSCVSLAPGGPGNLDVTELDAASHNGVDDMRELRDRALYAPAESRYRVFIIDEAHMITTAGANALLKIVEEPPAHLIFIFATTEPEKVLGTIRSRTHHYPFRLLTPPAMRSLLERTCTAEGVEVEDSVYPLVIRAGGGSPRDSLSVMDQLLAGAGPNGLTYDMAVPLLGVTDSSLIDAAVNALAEGDRATMFRTVADVIEAGHDPRRFTSDLLDRLRDLMVLQAVPDAVDMGLVDVPAAQVPVITEQAAAFGGSALARLASLANDGLDEMRGATAPRLLLEILCARMLLPAGTDSVAGVSQRLDLVEQGLNQLPDAPPATRAAALAATNQEQSRQQTEAPTSATPSPDGPRQPQAPVSEGARRAREAAERLARRGSGREQVPTRGQDAPESRPHTPATPPHPTDTAVHRSEGAPAAPDREPTAPESRPATPDAHDRDRGPEPRATGDTGTRQESPGDTRPESPSGPGQAPEPDRQPEPDGPGHDDVDTHTPTGTTPDTRNGDPADLIRRNWAQLRSAIGANNKVAEIMLTEARVLGVRGSTLVIGHNTGALASRLNAPGNNDAIVAALRNELQLDLTVECEVGTDPFDPPSPAPQDTPRPGKDPAPENRPAPEPEKTPVPDSTTGSPAGERSPEQIREQPSRRPSDSPPPATGWGTPAPLGGPTPGTDGGDDAGTADTGDEDRKRAGQQEPTAQPASENTTGRPWEQVINRVSRRQDRQPGPPTDTHSFTGGVPLPPEPFDDDPPVPDDPYGYPQDEGIPGPAAAVASRPETPVQDRDRGTVNGGVHAGTDPSESGTDQEEEDMLREAASGPGTPDRRTARDVAMELLSEELGARRL